MSGLIAIENDVFDIAKRLQEIDREYRIFYNVKKNRFEVHHRKRMPSLQVVLPYQKLDARALAHVQKTRIERKEALMREIEACNRKAEEERHGRIKKRVMERLEKEHLL